VNDFTQDEVPVVEPASSSTFSVGEELSVGEVSALAFSPQGLAKFGRSCLAILHQNLTLAIWTPGPNPRKPQSWKRLLVVNRGLNDYFQRVRPSATVETLRSKQRIRSFSWSPPASFQHRTEHFLAVSNDNNEVIIFWILPKSSDESTTITAPELSIQALTHSLATPFTEVPVPDSNWTFEDYITKRFAATQLSWSPWVAISEDNSLVAIIAWTTSTHLVFRQVHVMMSNDTPSITLGDNFVRYPFPAAASQISSIYWNPRIVGDCKVELIVSVGTTLWRHHLAVRGSIDLKTQNLERSDWEPISGMSSKSSRFTACRRLGKLYFESNICAILLPNLKTKQYHNFAVHLMVSEMLITIHTTLILRLLVLTK
jgi:hypothetical protein